MASANYRITFESDDKKIVDAEVEATFTPGEGFDSFEFDDITITDPTTGECELHDFMPEELVSWAEYISTCKDLSNL